MFKHDQLVILVGPNDGEGNVLNYAGVMHLFGKVGRVEGDAVQVNGVTCYNVGFVDGDSYVLLEASWLDGLRQPNLDLWSLVLQLTREVAMLRDRVEMLEVECDGEDCDGEEYI